MEDFILVSFIWLHPIVKTKFLHKSTWKNFFPIACYWLEKSILLREVDQKFLFSGKIGYGGSYLDCVLVTPNSFLTCKITRAFRLQAGGKRPGYCCIIRRGSNSCLLGDFIWLVFCLCLKLFLASLFYSIIVWNSMSLIAVDKKLTRNKNKKSELGLFIDGNEKVSHFELFQKTTNLINKQHGILIICVV